MWVIVHYLWKLNPFLVIMIEERLPKNSFENIFIFHSITSNIMMSTLNYVSKFSIWYCFDILFYWYLLILFHLFQGMRYFWLNNRLTRTHIYLKSIFLLFFYPQTTVTLVFYGKHVFHHFFFCNHKNEIYTLVLMTLTRSD